MKLFKDTKNTIDKVINFANVMHIRGFFLIKKPYR